ncbi:MAG: UDP-N-acetylmuramoyl-L-alanyl-D-glutamate--2,6-diaminopimelate ligase, partial [Bacteroidia bacterium]
MKTLANILTPVDEFELRGSNEIAVGGLRIDSRAVENGDVFFAIRGVLTDGHLYIDAAIELGAVAVVCEELPEKLKDGVSYVKVGSSSIAMGQMAAAYFDYPSKNIKVFGVTGTNGKTTVSTLLFELFESLGHPSGLISTVENRIHKTIIPSTHTTPDAISIQALMADMVKAGCSYCFMEVSSHAIHQQRIAGIDFTLAAFTNLSHDHLDYHGDFKSYIAAKKMLFDQLPATSMALINKDDKNGLVMVQNSKATKYTYALHSMADFTARIIEHDFGGMLLQIQGKEAWYHLVGKFNAYNLLTVYSSAFLLGMPSEEVITKLSALQSVSGRFEYAKTASGLTGIIDYAHTPDALQNVLETINAIRTKNENLITVVGCGGNRDYEKRPIMAKVASNLSDRVILTSDNPRNESAEAILADMQVG